MRGAVAVLIALVLVGYVSIKAATAFKAKTDIAQRVEHYLDFVDETSIESVKQDLIRDAKKFGVDLGPENIKVLYQDTELRTAAQQMVGGRLGAQFINKQVAISVNYQVRILGFPLKQDVTNSKIRQIQVRQAPRRDLDAIMNEEQK